MKYETLKFLYIILYFVFPLGQLLLSSLYRLDFSWEKHILVEGKEDLSNFQAETNTKSFEKQFLKESIKLIFVGFPV